MDENADASQAIFEPSPENWRRPPGRPRTTWTRNAHDDLRWSLGYMRLEIWRKIDLTPVPPPVCAHGMVWHGKCRFI